MGIVEKAVCQLLGLAAGTQHIVVVVMEVVPAANLGPVVAMKAVALPERLRKPWVSGST